jgi:hypothetical protein
MRRQLSLMRAVLAGAVLQGPRCQDHQLCQCRAVWRLWTGSCTRSVASRAVPAARAAGKVGTHQRQQPPIVGVSSCWPVLKSSAGWGARGMLPNMHDSTGVLQDRHAAHCR